MRVGAHVSIGKGLNEAISHAAAIGCDGFQIFAGSPRGWARKPIDAKEITLFKKRLLETKLHPAVVHASYLPNPATADPDLYQKSVLNISADFKKANQMGAAFFVLHPGRAKERPVGIKQLAQLVSFILEQIPGPTQLILENQAGGSQEMAARFTDLKLLLREVGQPERTGICFDTCHAFAAGYDLRNAAGWERALEELDREIGLSALKLFHLNDSKGELASGVDRHQHIGAGNIGLAGFSYLVRHPKLQNLAGILETPQEALGDDQRNLAILRRLMQE